jgi:aspartyl-tRNA(Asn)/glutamyl-tRNA(Gln) amidotransferase subunit C
MQKITRKTVEKVAKTARLDLSEKETKQMEKDLNSILSAFKELDRAPVKNAKPTFHPIPLQDVLREDVQEKCFTHEEALGNTEHKENGFFKGPKAV